MGRARGLRTDPPWRRKLPVCEAGLLLGARPEGPSRLGAQPGCFPSAVAPGRKPQAPLLRHRQGQDWIHVPASFCQLEFEALVRPESRASKPPDHREMSPRVTSEGPREPGGQRSEFSGLCGSTPQERARLCRFPRKSLDGGSSHVDGTTLHVLSGPLLPGPSSPWRDFHCLLVNITRSRAPRLLHEEEGNPCLEDSELLKVEWLKCVSFLREAVGLGSGTVETSQTKQHLLGLLSPENLYPSQIQLLRRLSGPDYETL